MLTTDHLWPEESLAAIHETALRLLEVVGVRVDSGAASDVLEAAGSRPAPRGRRLIPRALVESALAACPASFSFVARRDELSLAVDAEPAAIYVHSMGGGRDMLDPYTGEGRRAELADLRRCARVLHHLEHVHQVTAVVQPDDVPVELEPLYSYLALALESDKVVGGGGVNSTLQARHAVRMAQTLTGADGGEGRFGAGLAFSPVSPLHMGADVGDALVASVRDGGLACVVLPCPAAGTTAPAALSAAIAQQHAEVLLGVVLIQLVRPGTPVVYGARLSAADPRTGRVVLGTPEGTLASVAATLLARRVGLACDCYGPETDAKVTDAQFGWEHGLNAVLGMMARPRMLSGVGDCASGTGASLEGLVLDDEILNSIFYLLDDRPADADALDVDAIAEGVLSGNGFLATKHTRRYIRSEVVAPRVAYRGGDEEWLAAGRHSVTDFARERAEELLARDPVGLPDHLFAALCRAIDDAARELGLSDWPDPRRLLGASVAAR
jgi:trimethylamine--corrinoid protein Co-methyltransferase